MLWAINCIDKPNTTEMRTKHLAAHRKYLDDWDHIIFFSGPQQSDDGSNNFGSLFIVNVPSRAEAERFIQEETFSMAGAFESITISRLRKGRYHPELVDVA